MGWIRKFIGTDGALDWKGVQEQEYISPDAHGVSVRWLILPADEAASFGLRYFEVAPGGHTSLDRHAHDHGVVVLRGRGRVLLGEEVREISYGDTVYVSPHELHQLRCVGEEPLGFLCVIPALEGDGR